MLNYSDAIFPSSTYPKGCRIGIKESCDFGESFYVSLFFAQLLAGQNLGIRTISNWGNSYEENDTETVYGALNAGTTKTVLVDWYLTEERLKHFHFPIVYDSVSIGLITAKVRHPPNDIKGILRGIFAPLDVSNWIFVSFASIVLIACATLCPKKRELTLTLAAVLELFVCELYKSRLSAAFIQPKQNHLSYDTFDGLSELISQGKRHIVLMYNNSSYVSRLLSTGNELWLQKLRAELKKKPPIYMSVSGKEICKFLVRNPSYVLIDNVEDIRRQCRTECLEIPLWAQQQLPVTFRGLVVPKNHSLSEFAAQNAEAVTAYRATYAAFKSTNRQDCRGEPKNDHVASERFRLVMGGAIFAAIGYGLALIFLAFELLTHFLSIN